MAYCEKWYVFVKVYATQRLVSFVNKGNRGPSIKRGVFSQHIPKCLDSSGDQAYSLKSGQPSLVLG